MKKSPPEMWFRPFGRPAAMLPLLFAAGLAGVNAQTAFDLSQANFSEPFDDIATWTSPTTRSWAGLATNATGTVPSATRITSQSTTFVTSSSGGVQKGVGNLQLLSTGSTDNSSSSAIELNLNSTGRQIAGLSFDAACVFNSTGNRTSTLRIYYTSDGTTWSELTGTGLPFSATNNVASSASISLDPPANLDNQAALKLRFYYHNGSGGTTGSRPKISIDNLSITSSPLGDSTAPIVASLSPLAGATGVAVTSPLAITFSEPVAKGSTGDIVISRATDQNVVYTVPVTSSAVALAGSTATVTLPGVLAGSTGFYVTVAAGAFKDFAGNTFAGISDASTWAFTTQSSDVVAPALVSTTPASGATTVFPTSNLTLDYDEALVAGTGSVTIRKAADGSEVETLAVPSARVTLSGTTASIDPATILAYGTGYYVEVAAGTFKDASGNATAAIAGSSAWAFTTRSAPALVISQYYEGSGSDRFIELKNLTAQPLPLDGYRLVAWTDTAPSDNEGWKSGTATSVRVTALDGYSIPANGHFLVANSGVVNPAYALVNPDLTTPASTLPTDPVPVTAFNGDDSIVLYQGTGFTRDEVVDAVSFSANQGTDLSFYRTSDSLQGFDFNTGSSILDFSTVWGSKSLALVNSATAADPWYLSASKVVTSLTLSVTPTTFSEAAGASAATATVTRDGSTADDLFVNIESSDASEVSATTLVTIPAGQTSASFTIAAVNDPYRDGNQQVTLKVFADGYLGASVALTVEDEAGDPPLPVVINEIDSDTPGTDVAEFVELYNPLNEAISLDGVVLVLYNGSNDQSYWTKDLSGSTIPAKSYFVIGNLLTPNANITDLPDNFLQNGADAVALYAGAATAFPNGTPVTSATGLLLDALVYGTADPNDTGLLAALTPGMVQIDEGGNANTLNVSIARSGDSGAALDTANYVTQLPSPGAANPVPAAITGEPQSASIQAGQSATLSVTATGSAPLTYQWYEGLAGAVDKPVGTNAATFQTPALTETTSYWVRVSNPGRSVDSVAATVTVAPAGFAAWATATAPGQTAAQDHDGDGVANGVEFFMGLSGNSTTVNPSFVNGSVTWPNGGLLAPSAYGTAFVVQTSTDLAAWTNVASDDARLTNSANGVSFAPGTAAARIFIRLVVTP